MTLPFPLTPEPDTLTAETGRSFRMLIDPALYLAEDFILLSEMNKTPDRVEIMLVIGHNPGIADFASGPIRPMAAAAYSRVFSFSSFNAATSCGNAGAAACPMFPSDLTAWRRTSANVSVVALASSPTPGAANSFMFPRSRAAVSRTSGRSSANSNTIRSRTTCSFLPQASRFAAIRFRNTMSSD